LDLAGSEGAEGSAAAFIALLGKLSFVVPAFLVAQDVRFMPQFDGYIKLNSVVRVAIQTLSVWETRLVQRTGFQITHSFEWFIDIRIYWRPPVKPNAVGSPIAAFCEPMPESQPVWRGGVGASASSRIL
jgi:hypothetical protein